MSAWTLQSFALRTKLVGLAAVLVLAPGILYGVLTIGSMRSSLASVIRRQLADDARNAVDRLAALLRSQREILVSSARQDVMREIRIGDLDKRIASFLSSIASADPATAGLVVIDRAGRVVASTEPSALGAAGARFAPPRLDGPSAIDAPIGSPLDGRPSLRIAVRVPDPDHATSPLGTLVAFFEWERETAALASVRENRAAAGSTVDVWLADREGVLIGGGPTSASDAGALRRSDVLSGSASLPFDLPPWTVVVAAPKSEAFAPARRAARILVAVLATTLVIALALAVVAARRITKPLADLTRAAEEIGRSRAASPVPIHSGDEIGTLTAAFNRMAVDLRRAEKEVLDAAKFAFVGELAAGVAHEVRTPLGVMRSSAQLLERSIDSKDPETRELLQMLREEVDRIEHVVNGLLELGRPREIRVEPTPLGQVVFRAVDFAEVRARERGVGIRRLPAEPDPVALCDPELVYQVVLNLVVNAIQILPAGGEVEIALLPRTDGCVGFEIRDDGPGIPEEIRDEIFQPFFTRREGGAGLGLTFVQRVVQEHRGRVRVESNGRGTVFRIELPAAEEAA